MDEDLIRWLEEQLEEDARQLEAAKARMWGFEVGRVQLELESKRQLLRHLGRLAKMAPASSATEAYAALRAFAMPYADRPGCRRDWLPQ